MAVLGRIIRRNRRQYQKLAELRVWLLPMLMNGQVRVGSLRGTKQSHEANANNELGMVAESRVTYNKP
jgi:type I restriction enzyme S subunit